MQRLILELRYNTLSASHSSMKQANKEILVKK